MVHGPIQAAVDAVGQQHPGIPRSALRRAAAAAPARALAPAAPHAIAAAGVVHQPAPQLWRRVPAVRAGPS